jgi:hypothetical protein
MQSEPSTTNVVSLNPAQARISLTSENSLMIQIACRKHVAEFICFLVKSI